MTSIDYDLPIVNFDGPLVGKLLATQEAIVRLDERAKRSPVRDGWRERLLFGEACACQLTEGDLVHLEDLVLLDGNVRIGAASVPLAHTLHILHTWRCALANDAIDLLGSHRPGEVDPAAADVATAKFLIEDAAPATSLIDIARRDAWRHVVRTTAAQPPLIAAAVAWDAWLTLLPEPSAAWRAPLLAALILKARGSTGEFLLPIDTGRRFAPYRRQAGESFEQRLIGFLSWTETAATLAGKELHKLVLAGSLLRRRVKSRRRQSRLPALVTLLLSRPLVSVSLAAKALGCSHQAIEQMLPLLGSTPREVTGRKRFRAWAVV